MICGLSTFMFDLVGTSSHIACNLAITATVAAAAAHPGSSSSSANTCLKFKNIRPEYRIQSNSSEPHVPGRLLCTGWTPVFCVSPLQLVTPPGFLVNHISDRNLACICTKIAFFAHRRPFLFRPRVFPRALGCRHAWGKGVH